MGVPTSLMVSITGCSAAAVAAVLRVTVDDAKVQLMLRVVQKPYIVPEFEHHPDQVSWKAEGIWAIQH